MGLSTYFIFKQMAANSTKFHTLTQSEVSALHSVLLEMMDDIHFVCEKNELRYFLYGGCVLGSLRHGGFIPWDDDMDVCMPRKDYDCFRELFMKQYADKYYVQEIRSCENYDLSFMKVRLNGSIFCEPLDPEPEKSGIFIDIFPMENTFDSSFLRGVHQILSDGMQFICSCCRIHKKKARLLELAGENGEARKVIHTKDRLGRIFSIIPFRKWLLWTEKVLSMNHNERSKYVTVPTGGRHFRGELFPREWIFPVTPECFEDRKYCAMNQRENYVKQIYGKTWKILPPEEERERHVLLAFAMPDQQKGLF